jgi:hypothetical protein
MYPFSVRRNKHELHCPAIVTPAVAVLGDKRTGTDSAQLTYKLDIMVRGQFHPHREAS